MGTDRSLAAVEALADVATTDSEYRQFYLRRARTLLLHTVPPDTVAGYRRKRQRLPEQRTALGRAIEIGDWQEVVELSRQIQAVEEDLRRHAVSMTVAERVYRPDRLPTPTALAAHAISPLSAADLAACQARTIKELEDLTIADSEFRELYQERRAAIAALAITDTAQREVVDHAAALGELRDAFEHDQWERLATLAQGLIGGRKTERGECGCGRAVLSSPAVNEPVPYASAARDLGLESVRLEADDELRTYLACRCAEVPALMDRPLTPRTLELFAAACGCHHRCPALEDTLRLNVDLLKHRAFITSLGTRYLPSLASEALLVEQVPETLDAPRGPLLQRLGLPKRLGLCREEIEEALDMAGPDVTEDLGLDPARYVLVPIPFDAYLRAGPGRGWGRGAIWTHFDGYQVLRGWRLRALVGGDDRFGGLHDLCSIDPTDRRENVLLRLAVMHRQRMADPLERGSGDP